MAGWVGGWVGGIGIKAKLRPAGAGAWPELGKKIYLVKTLKVFFFVVILRCCIVVQDCTPSRE